jgi:hypothetical protein
MEVAQYRDRFLDFASLGQPGGWPACRRCRRACATYEVRLLSDDPPDDPPIALMITEMATRIGASPTATHGLMAMNNPIPSTKMMATTDKTMMLLVSRMM